MNTSYTLLSDYLSLKQGQVVTPFIGPTYGVVGDDEDILGEPCVAVQASAADGFTVVPFRLLKVTR